MGKTSFAPQAHAIENVSASYILAVLAVARRRGRQLEHD
jgi:hypothetical protein